MIVILMIDCLFYLMLIIYLLKPILQSRNQAQWGIIGKLVLLWGLNVVFISAAQGWLDTKYISPVLLVGVYTIIGLILVMAQRVLPFFIRNAITRRHNVVDYPHIPLLSLLSFVVFVIADLASWHLIMMLSGLAFVAVNIVRLYGWHDRELWYKPLLWVLYISLCFIVVGVFQRSTAHYIGAFPLLGLHAMNVGGIGLITVGMMARVILGHTGRNVFEPPYGISVIFLLLIGSAVLRSLLPMLIMEYYFVMVFLSQILWITAFVLLLMFYFVPLISKRVDGAYGQNVH